jgi:hypothetical protein
MPLSRIKSKMEVSQLRLDSSAASTDVDERVLLDGTDASDTDDGYAIILEHATANALDGGVATFNEMPLIGNVPIARVAPTADQTISNNTTTTVIFAGALFDQGDYFDFANNRYLPKVAGYYDVHCQIMENSGTDVHSIIIYIRKNIELICYSRIILSGTTNVDLYASTEVAHDIVYLNGVDDYVDFVAYITSEDAGSPIINAYMTGTLGLDTFATFKLIQRGPP